MSIDDINHSSRFLDPDLPDRHKLLQNDLTMERAKVKVLSKALKESHEKLEREEQQTNDKNQRIRLYESEQESLMFRNTQLTKRVESLQDELHMADQRKTKTATNKNIKSTSRPSTPRLTSSHRSTSSQSLPTDNSQATQEETVDAMATDLANKISENERLHNEIYKLTTDKNKQMIDLQSRVTSLEEILEKFREDSISEKSKYTQSVEFLENERSLLDNRLQEKKFDHNQALKNVSDLRKKLKTLDENSCDDLTKQTSIIKHYIPFNDVEFSHLSAYNLPLFDNSMQDAFISAFRQISCQIQSYFSQVTLFHSYLETNVQSITLTEIATFECREAIKNNFIQLLQKTKVYTKPLETITLIMIEEMQQKSDSFVFGADFKEFMEMFQNYTNFMTIIAKYHILWLQELLNSSRTNKELKKSMHNLIEITTKYPTIVRKIASILKIFIDNIRCLHSAEHLTSLFERLQANLLQLHENTNQLSLAFMQIIKLEDQLFPDEARKLNNSNIMTSLASLIKSSHRTLQCYTEFMPVLINYAKLVTQSLAAASNANEQDVMRKRAITYLNLASGLSNKILYQPPLLYPVAQSLSSHVFIPTSPPGQTDGTTASYQPRDMLSTQLQTLQGHLNQVEKERENTVLELEMLKLKFEKFIKNNNNNNNNNINNNNNNDNNNNQDSPLKIIDSSSGTSSEVDLITFLESPSRITIQSADSDSIIPIDSGESSSTSDSIQNNNENNNNNSNNINNMDNVLSLSEEEKEKLIISHFTQRILDLNLSLQTSESKAVYYYNELKSVSKHLSHLQLLRNRDHIEVVQAQETISTLQNDLHSTQKNYESQINLMSEHMISLTDQLSKKQEQVDTLTVDLTQRKKIKSSK